VRYRWKLNDVAIWDNRATSHTATQVFYWYSLSYHLIDIISRNDYGNDLRQGNRVVSIGEKPYFDSKSRSRREALGLEKVEF
jgi:hypothetical protein